MTDVHLLPDPGNMSWERRPLELANLLNPAFCGMLLSATIDGFHEERSAAMPYELVILALPLVLSETTRQKLPQRITTNMHVWLQRNPEVRMVLSERVRDLVPFFREALTLLMQRAIVRFDGTGRLIAGEKRFIPSSGSRWDSIREYQASARFVGRWLARSGSTEAIYILWGIRP